MKVAPITTIKTIVEKIEHGGPDVKVFSLVDPDRWELPPFRPGAHIDLHLPGKIVRTYSLCNEPAENSRYVVAVKRERSGRGGSIKLHDDVRPGDTIGVSLPRGGLQLDKKVSRFTFVAGGIGVTPFLSAAAHLLRTGGADFTLHLMVRGEAPVAALLAPLVEKGHVVIHNTATASRPEIASLIGRTPSDGAVGCCGPESMIADFEQATRGWSEEEWATAVARCQARGLLDAAGVACSTGSACSAGVAQPSHVLLAMGADDDRARSSLRFSLGHTSTRADVDALLAVLPGAVERARRARRPSPRPPRGTRGARRRALARILVTRRRSPHSGIGPNLPRSMSWKACWISWMLFITIGPYCTTGSSMGGSTAIALSWPNAST